MMVETAVVQFHICTISTCAISYFSFSDKVTHLDLFFDNATVFLWNFVDNNYFKLQKALFYLRKFYWFKNFFCYLSRFFLSTADFLI